jgi:hypothetical protein
VELKMPQSKKIELKSSPAGYPRQPYRGASRRGSERGHATLVQLLSRRFAQSDDSPELPLVIVNRVPQTKTVHVVVVWDRWRDLTPQQRDRVIVDSFAAGHPGQDEPVSFPMGLTPGEALHQGFLPYQINAHARAEDGVSAKDIDQAMKSAGGIFLRVGDDVQLRFATRGQAGEAYRRLLNRVNKPIWTLSEELSNSEV